MYTPFTNVPLGITRVEETMDGTAGTREERRGDNAISKL
jgi:hypothetical protein